VLRSRRNPPHAAQAPQKTGATIRNLASVAVVIALTLPQSSGGMVTT